MTAAVLIAAITIAAMIVSTRNDGYAQRTVRVVPGTHWLVDRTLGTVVLADAASGKATVRIDTRRVDHLLDSVQGPAGAFLVDRSTSQVLTIDQRSVKLADARSVPALDDQRSWTYGAGADVAIAAASDGTAVTIPEQGAVDEFDLAPTRSRRAIGVDGSVWTLREDELIERITDGRGTTIRVDGPTSDAMLSALGERGLLLDRIDRRIVWLPDGEPVALPLTLALADAIVQQPGPEAPCVWIAAADQLACVSATGIDTTVRFAAWSSNEPIGCSPRAASSPSSTPPERSSASTRRPERRPRSTISTGPIRPPSPCPPTRSRSGSTTSRDRQRSP